MDKKTLARHRKALEKEYARIRKCLDSLEKSGSLNGEASYEPSGITSHPADLGTDVFERDLNLGLVTEESEVLHDVRDALDRIEKGNYGICEACGGQVEPGRLSVIPYARNCLECQKKAES